MSNRAASFVEQWVSENAVKPVEGAPSGDDSEARLRAEACLAAAKDEGIAREDIEEETGDLVTYMGAVIANLVNHPERGAGELRGMADLVDGTPTGLGIREGLTYISAMPKRSPRIKLFEWRVIQLKATPARLIGYFEGASADDAIKRAIVEREIGDPLTQSRLAAQKVREIAT
jgi:hypothetical protein